MASVARASQSPHEKVTRRPVRCEAVAGHGVEPWVAHEKVTRRPVRCEDTATGLARGSTGNNENAGIARAWAELGREVLVGAGAVDPAGQVGEGCPG